MEAAKSEQGTAGRFSGLAAEGMKRLEAWLSLPSGDRAELLGGRIVYKTMASLAHGAAVMAIGEQINRFQGPPGVGGGGWWLSQEVDLFLSGQGLRPDVVGWLIDKHPSPPQKINLGEKHLGVYVASPDWVCEVLSPSTKSRDVEDGQKWRAYHEAGVGHYWLVDLDREQLTVYQRGEVSYEPHDVAGRQTVNLSLPSLASSFSPGAYSRWLRC